MKSITLYFVSLKLVLLRLIEQIKLVPLYTKKELLKIDIQYLIHYWNKNPYKICKNCEDKLSSVYGQTWPSNSYRIAQKMSLTHNSRLFDIGCGDGRFSLWLQAISGCTLFAFDMVGEFVEIASKISKKLGSKRAHFLKQNVLKVDYQKATHIYFYSTSFDSDFLKTLTQKFSQELISGCVVLTTSFELNDYCKQAQYRLIDELTLSYPWGNCQVYIQKKL